MRVRIAYPAVLPAHLTDLDDEYDVTTYTDVDYDARLVPGLGDTLIVDDRRAVTVTRRIWPAAGAEVDLILHTTAATP